MMKVDFCNHIRHPFSQGSLKFNTKQKAMSFLGLFFVPLAIPAIWTIAYFIKRNKIRNLTTSKSLSIQSEDASLLYRTNQAATKNGALGNGKGAPVVKQSGQVNLIDDYTGTNNTSQTTPTQSNGAQTPSMPSIPTHKTAPLPPKNLSGSIVGAQASKSSPPQTEPAQLPPQNLSGRIVGAQAPKFSPPQTEPAQLPPNNLSTDNPVASYLTEPATKRLPQDLVDRMKVVLTTKGFETPPGVTPNYFDKNNKRDTVEEIQGTPELRKAAREACEFYPNAFSPEVLNACREFNVEQYCMFKLKRISHVFGLHGRVNLPSGKDVNLEGFCEDFTIPMIVSSFNNFCDKYASNYDWLVKGNRNWIQKQLLNVLTTDRLEKVNLENLVEEIQGKDFKGPIAGGSGFDWHATISGLLGRTVFVGNRGAQCFKSGIAFYSFEDRSFFTTEVLQDISTRQNHNKHSVFGHQAWLAIGAKQTTIIDMPRQEVGNCTYRSVEAYLFALMAFLYMQETDPVNFYENLNNKQKLEEAFTAVRPVFNKWLHNDRKLVYNDLKNTLKELHQAGIHDNEYWLFLQLKNSVQNSAVYSKMKANS